MYIPKKISNIILVCSFVTSGMVVGERSSQSGIIEKKIEKHVAKFRSEVQMTKGILFALVSLSTITTCKKFVQMIISLFGKGSTTEKNHSMLAILFYHTFDIFQNAVATYIFHKGINYTTNYYLYDHPITWLLSVRVKIHDHFETLLCMISSQEKRIINTNISDQMKQYIFLFVKSVRKDIEKICSFMQYRSMLLPSYKQPTITLIQNNILAFLEDWSLVVQELLKAEKTDFKELCEKTIFFRTLVYEQIDLFKKIDDNKELMREIITMVQHATL